MAHHGDNPEGMSAEFLEGLKKLGPTGLFPEGKLTPHDEGEIRLGVTVENNKVVLAFGKPIAWIGMNRAQAIDLAEVLKKRAQEL